MPDEHHVAQVQLAADLAARRRRSRPATRTAPRPGGQVRAARADVVEQHDPEVARASAGTTSRHMFWSQPNPCASITTGPSAGPRTRCCSASDVHAAILAPLPSAPRPVHHGGVLTRLIFVRHGESVHSVERFVGGIAGCRGLTPLGHEQAAAVARRLAAEVLGAGRGVLVGAAAGDPDGGADRGRAGRRAETDCGLCTRHHPAYADGRPLPCSRPRALPGGGVHRPFQRENESWAELVVRTGRAIIDIACRHAGQTVVLVGHSETSTARSTSWGCSRCSRAFDTAVAPGSVTEWTADGPTRRPRHPPAGPCTASAPD